MTTPMPPQGAHDPQAELRREYVQAHRDHDRACKAAESKGLNFWDAGWPRVDFRRFAGLACGARTRAGGWCKLLSIYGSGRCKFHGGLSTGPRSVDGKTRAAANGLQPKRSSWSAEKC